MNAVTPNMADRIVVVGGGVAGLSVALRLAPRPVTLITASALGLGTATGWAQGGIAASVGADDAASLHAADTVAAGAGLTEPDVALRVAQAGPGLIDWLVRIGVPFDRTEDGALALGLEAAHGRRRIVRSGGDATGARVLEGLVRAVLATSSVEVVEARACDLLRDTRGAVAGIVAERDGARFRILARAVVLATGGVGALYAATTNPPGAVGGGLALAARAGAVMRDMEFVQFHPTAIAAGADPMPLATEALRGEGARLIDGAGEAVMAGITGGDLAPRDVVARGIFQALQRGRTVYLDARGALGAAMPKRFPTVAGLCAAAGIDPAVQPIPVRPAAHYHMGGVKVDAHGATSVPGLYACGEVSSTGLHGANRLASNSLLEGLAYAGFIADALDVPLPGAVAPETITPRSVADLSSIRRLMEAQVGVVRDAAGLEQAVATLEAHSETCDASLVALMIARGALTRRESRGAHWRSDFPHVAPAAHTDTTLATLKAEYRETTTAGTELAS
ncbi:MULTISPECIES: L-aspartate oxidase [unclassified Methylobacterium]|uniref:L-aspartate oxidase n=1 Tax=unclassified Methylobacterium TaxID=2615210 RepID=UPI0011C1D6C8|nr:MULTISPECIES: L-aspartate oxidase [unclassified Methylobacterium]QEE40549.1 L-aspartate oxidase [Methylobacterium sp. WL1]TXN59257.1 L-aspartate oxidase [Methylobacterium sp. WL2]